MRGFVRRPDGRRRGGPVLYTAAAVVTAAALALGATEAVIGPAIAAGSAADPTSGVDPQARITIDAPPPADLTTALPAVAADGPAPDPAALAAAIEAVPVGALTGTRSGTVLHPASGAVLYDGNAARPVLPASTMKVLTAVAALDLLGPDHVFTTRAVSPEAGTVVLVGGGDPYLSRSDLADLAAATARQLRADGATTVTVQGDASLFEGPQRHPDWPASYVDQASPVSALAVDQGRLAGTSPGPRTSTPEADAVRVFVDALTADGITVPAQSALGDPAAADARELASIDSAPLGAIVEELLVESDNDAAEVVAHQVGVAAGTGGSFEGGAAGTAQVLRERGAWDDAASLRDGSGLSRSNLVTPAMLAAAVSAAVEDVRLRPVLTGLPVGGATGTLESRFGAAEAAAGRGQVRAKTGTLRGTSALAGYAVTASGAVVVYAFVVNDANSDDAARAWLDRAAAAVATS